MTLIEDYIQPITSLLYPDCGGNHLDSHKSFTVCYKQDGDTGLSYHYDNSEITVNISLTDSFSGASLYFGDLHKTDMLQQASSIQPQHGVVPGSQEQLYTECRHNKGSGVIHRGLHKHGAMPLDEGERMNLIIWMRSSQIRNLCCPMCGEKPQRVKSSGKGDGFTEEMISLCNVT